MVTIVIFFTSCGDGPANYAEYNQYIQQYYNRPDSPAIHLVKKAIDFCGGWEAYTAIEGIDYQKTLHKADSTGQIIANITQRHRYNLFPQFSVRMDWEEGEDIYTIKNNGEESWKWKNKQHLKDQQNINSAFNSSHGSQYVLFIPWKLADPHVQLEYIGLQNLPNGKKGEGVMVNYTKDNSTTTDHTWWYFFDQESGKPIANFLKSPQGYSYTEYIDYEKIDSIFFHTKRKSYSADSTMKNLVLNTIYDNEEIKLIRSWPKKLFSFDG